MRPHQVTRPHPTAVPMARPQVMIWPGGLSKKSPFSPQKPTAEIPASPWDDGVGGLHAQPPLKADILGIMETWSSCPDTMVMGTR